MAGKAGMGGTGMRGKGGMAIEGMPGRGGRAGMAGRPGIAGMGGTGIGGNGGMSNGGKAQLVAIRRLPSLPCQHPHQYPLQSLWCLQRPLGGLQ